MTNKMIERVAKAIERKFMKSVLGDWNAIAKAAIAAMREPTDEMIKDTENVTIVSDETCVRIYQAMIDAALKE